MISDNIDEVMGLIPNDKLTMLIDLATKKKEDKVFGLLNDFMKEGFSLGLQLSNISQLIIRSNKLSDKDKAIIACKLGEIENHLSNGCNEYIQFYYLLYTLMALN
jgi:DNA polymerase III delta prime subunit